MKSFTGKVAGLVLILCTATPVQASVIPVDTGFQVTYGIGMSTGTSTGGDIGKVFIFEWDDNQLNVDYSFSIAGRGNTFLTHVIPFAPSSALAIGFAPGVAGIGDEKDHIYMLTNDFFAARVIGMRWSEIFPGSDTGRVRHSGLVSLLIDADAGDAISLASLTDFVTTEAHIASFDPTGSFTVVEFSLVPPPIGGDLPEPTTTALLVLSLLGAGYARRRRAH